MKFVAIIGIVLCLAVLVLYYTPGPSAQVRVDNSLAHGLELAPRIYRDKDWSPRGGPHIMTTLDALISDLRAAGEGSSEEARMACFRRADEALQALLDRKAFTADDASRLFYVRQMLLSLAGLEPKKFAQNGPMTAAPR